VIEEIKQQISQAKQRGDFAEAKTLQQRLIEIDKIPKKTKIPKVATP
jgi:DNA-binding ferritin-like protein